MKADELLMSLKGINMDFYTGVPDSQLRALCDCLMENQGISSGHIIAANEGNAVALAAGAYLATGKIPVIYMQNSGIGNAVNPILSLTGEKVYGIPCIFIVGWRGEPGVPDEPQHAAQGEVTLQLLKDLGFRVYIIGRDTSAEDISQELEASREWFVQGKSLAFVVRKGALQSDRKMQYGNAYVLSREQAIECITEVSGRDVIVATTGKAGRELYEIRERRGQTHHSDFLTVGSMGHCSSVALGIALNMPERKVWCIDGDGALLMHMGALAVIGSRRPKNLVHIVIDNESHESVGGMPTAAATMDIPQIAKACGYEIAATVKTLEELRERAECVKREAALSLIEIKCALGARADLGRPLTTPRENKENFMKYLDSWEM